jgi:hypothetical protein
MQRSQGSTTPDLHTWRSGVVRAAGQGKVYLSMKGIGGVVDTMGTEVSGWIGAFLRGDERADVISKLAVGRQHVASF